MMKFLIANKSLSQVFRLAPQSRLYAGNVAESRKSPGSFKDKQTDEKLVALMAYREVKGLCYKCGSKWGLQHNC